MTKYMLEMLVLNALAQDRHKATLNRESCRWWMAKAPYLKWWTTPVPYNGLAPLAQLLSL